jgi:hypothetical protein
MFEGFPLSMLFSSSSNIFVFNWKIRFFFVFFFAFEGYQAFPKWTPPILGAACGSFVLGVMRRQIFVVVVFVVVAVAALIWAAGYNVEDVPFPHKDRKLSLAALEKRGGRTDTRDGSHIPSGRHWLPQMRLVADGCDFTVHGGWWTVEGTVEDVEDPRRNEHVIHWHPVATAARGCDPSDPSREVAYRRFSQLEALQCLQGSGVVMYGNSNTRTLFIALEALLKGVPMTSRVAAKQRCDNSRSNHSCWATVVIDGFPPIDLLYISYTNDPHDGALGRKILDWVDRRGGVVDIVLGNSGLNAIQVYDDHVVWRRHKATGPKLVEFIRSLGNYSATRAVRGTRGCAPYAAPTPRPVFAWHLTTPTCANQPHFKRYRYNAKHWRFRTVPQINAAVARSNELVRQFLRQSQEKTDGSAAKVSIVNAWGMMENWATRNGSSRSRFDLCPYFEDPLHHRFMDREIVQLLLNQHCYCI